MKLDCGLIIKNFCLIRGNKELFKNFTICFERNKITAILAPSGTGKTSLLEAIAGLLPYQSGTIECIKDEKQISISYLFQEPRLLPWVNILQNCMIPLENLFSKDEAQKRAEHFLSLCNLFDKKNVPPCKLSGGEKQRCSLARTFAYPAPVLLMDEAFQSQDIATKELLFSLFKSILKKEPRTVLLVTHDIKEALALADRIVVLQHKNNESVLDIYLDKNKNEINSEKIQKEITNILEGV